jgi:rubredoxin
MVGPDTDKCPECGASWEGKEIPEESRHLYAGKPFFSRLVGIYSLYHDRIVNWQCPDCKKEFPRE